MNRNIRQKDVQSAQGMVEFALVLPILMMLILGIIAFGHLFFVYTTVVSASREASRWGMATGTSTNGGPRYKDCDAIRAAAVRVGAFAGVGPDQVTISYDHGPDDTVSAFTCPYDAELYDRIKISITVDYKPIVPFADIPSVPLTATSSRTIMMGQQVGVVPTAGLLEPTTMIQVIPSPDASATSSKTNEPQTFNIIVTSADNSLPTGTVTFKDTTTNQNSSCGASFSPPGPAGTAKACSFTFDTNGAHTLVATFTPSGIYIGAPPVTLVWVVSSKLTTTDIVSVFPENKQTLGYGVDVVVHVATKAPDTGTPNGNVILWYGSEMIATAALDGDGNATFTGALLNAPGANNLTATFEGNTEYGSSQDSITYTMETLKMPILTPSSSPKSGALAGVNVTFTLSVDAENAGDPRPIGTVTFTDNASPAHSCSVAVGSDGKANCSWSYTEGGLFTVTAVYSGDGRYLGGSRIIPYVINGVAQDTQVGIAVSPSTGYANEPVTITVQVSSAEAVPTGAVNITGTGGLSCPNPLALDSNGMAICTYTYTQVNYPNPWAISADYVSDNAALFKNSSGSTEYVVNPNETKITISPTPSSDQFQLNDLVTFTVSVVSIQGGTPTGTVDVSGEAGINCQNLPLVNGQATCAASYAIYGTYRVTAVYHSTSNVFLDSGPANYNFYAWPLATAPAGNCPQPPPGFEINFSTSKQLKFVISNASGNPTQDIQQVDVYWPDTSQANLKQLKLRNSTFYTSNGLPPTVAKIPISPATGAIKDNKTAILYIVFDQSLGSGTYVVQVKFTNNNCVLTVRDTK